MTYGHEIISIEPEIDFFIEWRKRMNEIKLHEQFIRDTRRRVLLEVYPHLEPTSDVMSTTVISEKIRALFTLLTPTQ